MPRTIEIPYLLAPGDPQHNIPATIAKYSLEVFSDESSIEFAQWYLSFNRLVQDLQISEAVTRRIFPTCFSGQAREILNTLPATATLFEQSQALMIFFYPRDLAPSFQQELSQIKKRRNETISEYDLRIQAARYKVECALRQDPVHGGEFSLSDYHLMQIFLNGLPPTFRTKIIEFGSQSYEEVKNDTIKIFAAERTNNPQDSRLNRQQPSRTRNTINTNNNNNRAHRNNRDNRNNRFNNQNQRNDQKQTDKNNRNTWCTFHQSNTHNTQNCRARSNSQQQARLPSHNSATVQITPQLPNSTIQDTNTYQAQTITIQAMETLKVRCDINQRPFSALLDSGSATSLMSFAAYQKINTPLTQSHAQIVAANGQRCPVKGTTTIHLKLPQLSPSYAVPITLLIVDQLTSDIILGMDFLVRSKSRISFDKSEIEMFDKKLVLSHTTEELTTTIADDADSPDTLLFESAFPCFATSITVNDIKTKINNELETIWSDIVGSDDHMGKLDPNLGQFNINLINASKVVRRKAYPLPRIYEQQVRTEIDKLLKLGVIQHSNSNFASPAFVVPKKSGQIRLVVDYRELNTNTQVPRHPIPDPREAFYALHGTKYFSTIDLNSGYYQVSVYPEARKYLAFVVPFGQFEFLRMPFGPSGAPSVFQGIMNRLFADHRSYTFPYLDDLLVFSSTLDEHLRHLREVFHILRSANLTINRSKSNFLTNSVEYLGYEISPAGIKPAKRHLDILKKISMPTNRKEVQRLLGMLNFFRQNVPNFSARLSEVITLTRKDTNFKWTSQLTESVHSVIDDLIQRGETHHPNFQQPFELYTDASDNAIGAALFQHNVPIQFFSKRLSQAQRSYTVSEKECLAIVEFLTRNRKFLLGTKLTIFTDHSNLKFLSTSALQRIQRWKLLIDVFSPTIRYVPGTHNNMADYLSRDLNLSTITVLDKQQQQSFINWYHERLCHPGITRQYYTMKAVTTWPNLYQQLVSFINNCTTCQQMKNVKKSYGKLTGSLLNEIPFHTLAIDLYGPVSFPANETENEEVEEHRYILSMIDHCTRLVELAPLKTITAEEVIERLKDYWLCRYPRPHQILSDNGTQFTSKEFADLLTQYDVLHITTTTYNPTGNSVVERIHGTLGNALRTLNVHNWSDYLPDIVYSFRTSYQRSLGCSPAELVFSRHMVAYEPCSREKLLERANAKSKKMCKHPINASTQAALIIVINLAISFTSNLSNRPNSNHAITVLIRSSPSTLPIIRLRLITALISKPSTFAVLSHFLKRAGCRKDNMICSQILYSD
jgi:hypothetical protein